MYVGTYFTIYCIRLFLLKACQMLCEYVTYYLIWKIILDVVKSKTRMVASLADIKISSPESGEHVLFWHWHVAITCLYYKLFL